MEGVENFIWIICFIFFRIKVLICGWKGKNMILFRVLVKMRRSWGKRKGGGKIFYVIWRKGRSKFRV